MKRTLAVLVVLLVCVYSGPRSRPVQLPFHVDGITDPVIVKVGQYDWQVTYQSPGSAGSWYPDLIRELERAQWSSMDQPAYGALSRTFMRTSPVGVGDVRRWVFMSFDPNEPDKLNIRFRSVLVVPSWQRLLRMITPW